MHIPAKYFTKYNKDQFEDQFSLVNNILLNTNQTPRKGNFVLNPWKNLGIIDSLYSIHSSEYSRKLI